MIQHQASAMKSQAALDDVQSCLCALARAYIPDSAKIATFYEVTCRQYCLSGSSVDQRPLVRHTQTAGIFLEE